MKQRYSHLKSEAISLRKQGKMYSEIQEILNEKVPKSTLSLWFKEVKFSKAQNEVLKRRIENKLIESRKIAHKIIRERRNEYLKQVEARVSHLKNVIKNKDTAKIALAMLYLGEGSKNRNGSMTIGNSDPRIIGLFINLMKKCYEIDSRKFRCTLQCRADQNIKELEKFWSDTTGIPLSQFYEAKIDPRTIGKKSKNENYKGVCRIDYFSADLYNELTKIAEVITSLGL